MPRKKKSAFDEYFEVNARHLRDRLALFKPLLLKRADRKDLMSYHFTVRRDGSAIVAGRDLEHGLELKLKVLRRVGWGTVMIEAQALDAMLGSYPEETIRIGLVDKKKVGAKGVRIDLELPGYDPEKELKLTAEGCLARSGWLFQGRQLAMALRRTRFAADKTNSTRYAIAAIAINLPDAGREKAELVGTDGRKLSRVRIAASPFGVDPARAWRPSDPKAVAPTVYWPLLPSKVVPVALKLAEEADSDAIGISVLPGAVKDLVKQTFGPGRVQVVTRDAVLTAEIPAGRFPPYEEVWPTTEVRATLRFADARTLGKVIATAVAATDSESRAVEIVLADGNMMITSKSGTRGEVMQTLQSPDSTGRATISLDAIWFREFFDVIGADAIQIQVFAKDEKGHDQGIVIQVGTYHDFILMPIQTHTEAKDPAAPVDTPAPEDEDEGDDEGEGEPEPPAPRPEPKPEAKPGRKRKAKPEPEPVTPAAAKPDGHVGNGEAEPPRRRKK
jgi:DNA polymerase III sliding clamp (beta) subunit (PCNA family)